ncbi:MAG: RdgB/HAM1 family non-canonical purine NTP pyrophosphatase [Nanobdellota archaeon]
MKLVFITGNMNKAREVKQILKDFEIGVENLNLVEIQGSSDEIIKRKLADAKHAFGGGVFVEDTALVLDSLKGLPGPYIKDFLKNISLEGLYKLANIYNNPKAIAQCFVGYIDKSGTTHIFKGETKGTIVKPRVKSNFGWDPIFLPDGFEKTFSEMSSNEKNMVSHRKKAFEKFRDFLYK